MNFERYALYGLKIFVSFIQISGDYYRLTCFHLIVSSKSNTTEQSLFVSRPIRRCVYDTTERTPFHVLSWPCNPHYIFLFSTQSGLGPDFCQGWWRNTFASTCHGWIFTGIRRRECSKYCRCFYCRFFNEEPRSGFAYAKGYSKILSSFSPLPSSSWIWSSTIGL